MSENGEDLVWVEEYKPKPVIVQFSFRRNGQLYVLDSHGQMWTREHGELENENRQGWTWFKVKGPHDEA